MSLVGQMREKSLQIYGESWECLEQPKLWGSVTELLFKFVTVERIAERAMPLILQVPLFTRNHSRPRQVDIWW